jgi:hypothetical protein
MHRTHKEGPPVWRALGPVAGLWTDTVRVGASDSEITQPALGFTTANRRGEAENRLLPHQAAQGLSG